MLLLISFLWMLLCIALYYCMSDSWLEALFVHSRLIMPLLIVASLFVRLVPAMLLSRGAAYDIESFERVAKALMLGDGVYNSPLVQGRHPYFPLQMYFIGAAMLVSKTIGWPFAFVVKWLPIVADGALSALIFKAYARSEAKTGLRLAISYALNPVSILISAYHGQFDAVPAFLLALSWYLWCIGKIQWSALALGFAVLDKTWPLIFLPIPLLRLRVWGERLKYGFICIGVPVIGTAFYLFFFPGDFSPLLRRALTHAGVPGWWGVSAILNVIWASTEKGENLLGYMAVYGRWLMLICVGMVYWLTRSWPAIHSLVMAILTLYVSTTGFGLQWGLWVVPFALLSGDDRWLKWYTGAFLLHLLPSYFGYHLDQTLTNLIGFQRMALLMQVSSIPAWAMTLFWLFYRFSQHQDRFNDGSPPF